MRKSLDICLEILGEKHPHTATGYNQVAVNLHAQSEHAAALPLYQKALDIRREVLGEKHPDTALSYSNLAVNLNAQGQYAAALPLLQKALDLRQVVLGEKHPETAASCNNVAMNLNAQGKHGAALPLLQKALDIRREVLGVKHPLTAQSYNNVAFNLYAQGKYALAQPLFQKALDIRREVFGEKHPDTAQSCNNVAANQRLLSQAQGDQLAKLEARINKHDDAGEFGEVVRLAREALALRELWHGHKHWETVDARFRVERWQRLADLPVDKQKKLAPAMLLLGQGWLSIYANSMPPRTKRCASRLISAWRYLARSIPTRRLATTK